MLAFFDLKMKIGEELLPVKSLCETLDGKDILAAVDLRCESELHDRVVSERLVGHVHPREHFLTALCALDRFLAVEGFQLRDDLLLMLPFLLSLHVGQVLRMADLLLLFAVGVVVAAVGAGPAVIQLDDLRDDPVQEITVVGDDEDRPFIIEKIGL